MPMEMFGSHLVNGENVSAVIDLPFGGECSNVSSFFVEHFFPGG